MKKKTAIVPVEMEKGVLTPAQEQLLEERLPKWVKELADTGTAVLRWNTEFLYLIQGILAKDFGFTESENGKLVNKVKELLPEIHKLTVKGVVLLRPNDMAKALDMVEAMKQQIKMEKSKIALPSQADIKRISK